MEFSHVIPTELYFGTNIIQKKKSVFSQWGRKALIVTGKHSAKKNGSLEDVLSVLKEQQIDYVIFDQIEENPSLETIELGKKIGTESKVDFVIGIGGGSPLDAAKAIALFIKNPDISKENIFKAPQLTYLPVLTIPTTAGTGSEVTPYSIVTVNTQQIKRNLGQKIYPKAAFLDSKYTLDMPYEVTVNTAVDALTHLVEGYLNTNATFMSDIYVQKGVELFAGCIPALLNRQITSDTRNDLLCASMLAGMVLTQTGTSLPHGMGYALTYHKGLAHGLANGVLLIAYLKTFKEQKNLMKLLHFMNMDSIKDLENVIKQLVHVEIEITQDEIIKYSNDLYKNKGKLKNHPEEVSLEEIIGIYKESLCYCSHPNEGLD